MEEQKRPVVHEGMGAPELVEALRAGDTAFRKKGPGDARQPALHEHAAAGRRRCTMLTCGCERSLPRFWVGLRRTSRPVRARHCGVARRRRPQVRRAAADALVSCCRRSWPRTRRHSRLGWRCQLAGALTLNPNPNPSPSPN